MYTQTHAHMHTNTLTWAHIYKNEPFQVKEGTKQNRKLVQMKFPPKGSLSIPTTSLRDISGRSSPHFSFFLSLSYTDDEST